MWGARGLCKRATSTLAGLGVGAVNLSGQRDTDACGIVGVVGRENDDARGFLLEGLAVSELGGDRSGYRGYRCRLLHLGVGDVISTTMTPSLEVHCAFKTHHTTTHRCFETAGTIRRELRRWSQLAVSTTPCTDYQHTTPTY